MGARAAGENDVLRTAARRLRRAEGIAVLQLRPPDTPLLLRLLPIDTVAAAAALQARLRQAPVAAVSELDDYAWVDQATLSL
jgi:hypothetical protein